MTRFSKMTYELVAQILWEDCDNYYTRKILARKFAVQFEEDNPDRFDKKCFYTKCGLDTKTTALGDTIVV